MKKQYKRKIKNEEGQGLIEYLIIVALVAVATIGIIRSLQNTVGVQYAEIVSSLQGGSKKIDKPDKIYKSLYKKKDLQSFMKNSSRGSKK